jgi:hypothetical protein
VDYCTTVVTAEKPADSVGPRLERALRLAAEADSETALVQAVEHVAAVGRDVADRLPAVLNALAASQPGRTRYAAIQQVRRLLRG